MKIETSWTPEQRYVAIRRKALKGMKLVKKCNGCRRSNRNEYGLKAGRDFPGSM